MTELAEQLPGHINLEDLAVVVDVFRRIRVGNVHHLPRTLRDADGARRTDVEELRLEIAIGVEHLDAPVARVGDVDETLCVYRDAARLTELAIRGPGLSPRPDELPVLVELRDAVVVAEAVGNIEIACRIPRNVGRTVEHVLLTACSRRTSAAAATTTFGVTSAATRAGPARAGTSGPRTPATRCTARRRTTSRRTTATGRRRRRRAAGGYVFRLRLAAEQHHEAPFCIEFHDGVRHLLNHPDVVLRIDLDLLGKQHCVGGLANLADVLSGLVESEHPRSAVSERPRGAERQRWMPGSRVHEGVAFRVCRDAGHFAEVEIGRQLQWLDRHVVRDLRDDELRRERRDGKREDAGCKLNGALHVGLLISP